MSDLATSTDVHMVRRDLQHCLRSATQRPSLRVDSIAPILDGHSGFTYFVGASAGEWRQEFVLRLPPPGTRPTGPADVVRQGRIMTALHAHGLPVPAIIAASDDATLLDGRPFCLMERAHGVRIESARTQFATKDILCAAVKVLRQLQDVPDAATGLAEEAPVDHVGEVLRWERLMVRTPPELTGQAAELLGRIRARMPREDSHSVLVHGDFQAGNLLFEPAADGTPTVSAVLDWEIAQRGCRSLDITSLCVLSSRFWIPGAPNPGGGLDIDPQDVVDLYGEVHDFGWSMAVSFYKYAAIFGYNLGLHRRGRRPDAMYEELTEVIPAMIAHGLDHLS